MINNMFLINAPAGSGKTTYIRRKIIDYSTSFPNDYILCITYTNRAADELSYEINSEFIVVKTIHSFINDTLKPFFKHPYIIDLYFEVYCEKISARIQNSDNKDHILVSNQRYIDKHGRLDMETLRKNIKEIYYNESEFNSLYYGGISHDDLLSFAYSAFQKFPILRKKISSRYSLVFIDEYQDTSQYLLKIIYDTFLETDTEVFFLGDRMQRIYNNYDYSFEDIFREMNDSISLTTNYRSNSNIVSVLNKLYNNNELHQSSSNNQMYEDSHPPRVIIAENVDEEVLKCINAESDAIKLYLPNARRFESLGAGNLFKAVTKMEEYKYGSKYNATEVLTLPYDSNPDPHFKLIFTLLELNRLYTVGNLGSIIQIIKSHPRIFLQPSDIFNVCEVKAKFNTFFQNLRQVLDKQDNEIGALMEFVLEEDILMADFREALIPNENLYKVRVQEIISMDLLRQTKKVSTQHGVKGESHDSVLLIVEDNHQLNVNMYSFLELLAKKDINLHILEELHFKYSKMISEFEIENIEISNLNKHNHSEFSQNISDLYDEILEEFGENEIFNILYGASYCNYHSKPNIGNTKKCFISTPSKNCLNAYKLFYVGCSRARKNLTVFIDKSKIISFSDLIIEKFNRIGFDVTIL